MDLLLWFVIFKWHCLLLMIICDCWLGRLPCRYINSGWLWYLVDRLCMSRVPHRYTNSLGLDSMKEPDLCLWFYKWTGHLHYDHVGHAFMYCCFMTCDREFIQLIIVVLCCKNMFPTLWKSQWERNLAKKLLSSN